MHPLTRTARASETTAPPARRILVFDAFVRVFHWLLAAAFIAAFGLANLADDHSDAFIAHMLIGMVIVFIVALRIVWGFVGSRYARFGSFLFGPRETASYMAGVLGRTDDRNYVGHNPGSAWAIFAMLVLFIGLGVTGLLNARGLEAAEELHEILAWSVAGLAAIHVAGVFLHVVRRKENIVASMIHGHKRGTAEAAIGAPRRWAAVALVLLTGLWAFAIVDGYDRTTQSLTIPLTGTTLQLGEEEEEGEERSATSAATTEGRERDHDTEEDDD
jgi:cytochrome b